MPTPLGSPPGSSNSPSPPPPSALAGSAHQPPAPSGKDGLSTKEVREIAVLARLALSDQEVDRMARDLDAILGYVAALGELDTASVEPMTHAVPFDCPLREDRVQASLSTEEALGGAPKREASFFQVPRIIVAGGRGEGEG